MAAQRSRGNLAVVEEDGWETPPKFHVETGSAFGWNDRLFYGWSADGAIFDYGDFDARELQKMLDRDYKARQIESVLSLPIMSAERQLKGLKGDKGELDWLEAAWDADFFDGGSLTTLDEVIGTCTTAFTYRKAFHELVFRQGYDDKVFFEKIAFRPATTCRMKRDPRNGTFLGFEQEAYAGGPSITTGSYPVQIEPQRAFVFLHGSRLDPINGTSDLQVAHWCYKTKQKLLFLWMQFLESVALPRTVVKSQDTEVAKQIAAQIARMRGSAVIPIGTNGDPKSVDIATLDSSGKGAEQFMQAITWLDTAATQSVLAGFLDLTGMAAARGVGSFALSKDASDYYLQFEEAKARELERQIRRELFGPILRWNFGMKAKVPKLQFEPLNTEDKSQQIALLQAFAQMPPGGAIPTEFVAMLANQVATYFGMDGTKVHDLFVEAGQQAAAAAAAQSAAGASPLGQQVATVAGATKAATGIVAPDGPKKPLPPQLQHLDWGALGQQAA